MDNRIYNKVFLWMFAGLLITFITGYSISLNSNMIFNLLSGWEFLVYIIEIIIVIVLNRKIMTMDEMTAKILFCLYSFMTGLTFSILFIAYQMSSIIYVFGIASLLFGVFALIGSKTKLDLSKFSTVLFMGLIGVIVVSIINAFIGSRQLDMGLSWFCIILFMGITAYDMQKVRYIAQNIPNENKAAIIGSLELYLDFINIFIRLLSLFGKNRND